MPKVPNKSKYDLPPAQAQADTQAHIDAFKRDRAGHLRNIAIFEATAPRDDEDAEGIRASIEKAKADVATIEAAIDTLSS